MKRRNRIEFAFLYTIKSFKKCNYTKKLVSNFTNLSVDPSVKFWIFNNKIWFTKTSNHNYQGIDYTKLYKLKRDSYF